jgi:excinuclease UvrABC nuclease subunit
MTELVSAKQIWLLTYENPLNKRLGKEFFRSIPCTPGVYWMFDENKNILYVGKAKNLKNRLQSYPRIKPDQSSRKLVRMVHLVREICWEECDSETAALLRENHLLRAHRPPFNTLNTRPESYYFLGYVTSLSHLNFRLTTSPVAESDQLYGAFKGRSLVRHGYAALLRLLWVSLGELAPERFEYPGVLTRKNIPYRYSIFAGDNPKSSDMRKWNSLIQRFLRGTSKSLLVHLTEKLLDRPGIPPFAYHYIQTDLETIAEFFRYGPHRNRCLKKFHGIHEPILAQEKIDDLLVTYRLKSS